jgi:hypothetical protein
MDDAKIYRERAQLLSDAASAASNEQVRLTLLRWVRSALQTATEIEASPPEESDPKTTGSDKEIGGTSPKRRT